MLNFALGIQPHAACLVPERREERTTEGGLDVIGGHNHLRPFTSELSRAGIVVSLFVEPEAEAIEAARSIGAPVSSSIPGPGAMPWPMAPAKRPRPNLRG